MTNVMTVSNQWATRPTDQRFLTLDALEASVLQRKQESWTTAPQVRDLRVLPADDNSIVVNAYDPVSAQVRELTPTNFAFGQLAGYAKAPASYLRQLPAELAAINLQYGLEFNAQREDALVYGQSNGAETLRAMTSTSYGRIYDADVVAAVKRATRHGAWQVPASRQGATKAATTLYASDRDVFIFLCDPTHSIQVGDEELVRAFYVWNSEVGSATFGIATMLYRYICENRIIWGATQINELRVRHTLGAPERFENEGEALLERYANEDTVQAVRAIEAAKAYEIPKAAEKDTVASWLQKRGFTAKVAKAAVVAAETEEGQARTLWDVIQGVTAHARTIPFTDERVAVERAAGDLMKLAEGRERIISR